MRLPTLGALFFLSGAAGLIFEVLWIRYFGNIFGNTIYSSGVVTAIYMGGLGLGAFLAGRWADRRAMNALRAYAYLEMGVAVAAIFSFETLRASEQWTPLVSHYAQGGDGWFRLSLASHAARYVFAIAILFPVALVIGASLPIMARHALSGSASPPGWTVGVLYGMNTLGAAAGALLVDTVLVPSWGVHATGFIGALLSLTAGLAAFFFARTGQSLPIHLNERKTEGLSRVAAILMVSGFVGMGMEIFWFRFLSSLLGAQRIVFSLVLSILLASLWLGSLLGGFLDRRFGNPLRWLIVFQSALVLLFISCLWVVDPSPELSLFLSKAWACLAVVALPGICLGAIFPLANAYTQTESARVGRRLGGLYLANTLGAVAGSLVTAFWLMPIFGMQLTVTGLGVLALGGAVLTVSGLPVSHKPRWLGALGVLGLIVVIFGLQPRETLVLAMFEKRDAAERILKVSEGLTETLLITEMEKGDQLSRILYTDGHLMSGTLEGPSRYMRAFAHLPLLQLEAPKNALVICFGVGNTLHAASLHPSLERLELVDLSENVLRHAGHFEAWNRQVLEDARVRVFINDGRLHLRMGTEPAYDLITLEPPPITFAGVAALYSKEFYALALARLADGGILTQWLPVSQVPGDQALSLIRSFREVFPGAALLSGFKDHFILMGRKGAELKISLKEIERKLSSLPQVQEDLRRIRMGNSLEILGTFIAGARVLTRVSESQPPLTDDKPSLEYVEEVRSSRLPSALFSQPDIRSWCPSCSEKDLGRYLALMAFYYPSREFPANGGVGPGFMQSLNSEMREGLGELMARSPYLRELF